MGPRKQNGSSFSDEYSRKLEQKQDRKAFIADIVNRSNDRIMAREHKQKQAQHEKALMQEAIRESQQRFNFKYMEWLKKK